MAEESIKLEMKANSPRLYFLFGGIQGELAMPPFEFYRAAGVLEYSKVFLRDFAQAWYQRGLPGIGEDQNAIADYLRQTIDEAGVCDVRFVGNSMGGFASLLFCTLLRTGRAIAFAPQTFVSADLRLRHADRRWSDQINRLHRDLTGREILDLHSFISQHHPDLEADIYVAKDHDLDFLHASRLQEFPNVRVHAIQGDGGHGVVRQLRDAGVLEEILG